MELSRKWGATTDVLCSLRDIILDERPPFAGAQSEVTVREIATMRMRKLSNEVERCPPE